MIGTLDFQTTGGIVHSAGLALFVLPVFVVFAIGIFDFATKPEVRNSFIDELIKQKKGIPLNPRNWILFPKGTNPWLIDHIGKAYFSMIVGLLLMGISTEIS